MLFGDRNDRNARKPASMAVRKKPPLWQRLMPQRPAAPRVAGRQAGKTGERDFGKALQPLLRYLDPRPWLLPAFNLAALGAVLYVLHLGYAWLMAPQTLPVRQVQVDGVHQHLEADQLRARVEAEIARGFLAMNLDRAREAVGEVPWVDEVVLVREWPDTLRIQVTEHVPLARWGGGQVMNVRGELFSPPIDDFVLALPALSGAQGRHWALWERYLTLREVLGEVGLGLGGVREDERGSLSLLLANGVVLRTGRQDVEARVQRFLEVYPAALKEHIARVGSIDLRHTNGFAVSWREPPAAGEQSLHKDSGSVRPVPPTGPARGVRTNGA
ncbi:MAG: FtsQ-type POTRA domain-containing protein [Halothiobacillaceae bacterium]|nr:FtsQ-type POTRA domain-containing protein [Halothiobacillaceae bacterium]